MSVTVSIDVRKSLTSIVSSSILSAWISLICNIKNAPPFVVVLFYYSTIPFLIIKGNVIVRKAPYLDLLLFTDTICISPIIIEPQTVMSIKSC